MPNLVRIAHVTAKWVQDSNAVEMSNEGWTLDEHEDEVSYRLMSDVELAEMQGHYIKDDPHHYVEIKNLGWIHDDELTPIKQAIETYQTAEYRKWFLKNRCDGCDDFEICGFRKDGDVEQSPCAEREDEAAAQAIHEAEHDL